MDRIDNVDLREALGRIAECNTNFHLDSDLNISIEQMERAAKLNDSNSYSEKTLIWISYPSGIDCYTEREAFQKDTRGYNGVLFHGFDMPSDLKNAYIIDVLEIKDGKVFGTLYETDIKEYAASVRENAVSSNNIRIYLHGGSDQIVMPKDEFNRRYPLDLVKLTYWRHEPDDQNALKSIIDNLWNNDRNGKHEECDLWLHTSKLSDKRYKFCADQLLRNLNKLDKPNSADKQSFTVLLHSDTAASFSSAQLSRVLDNLPYENAAFTVQKGQSSMKLVIPSDAIMKERQIKQGKPSILKALRENADNSRRQYESKPEPKKSKGTEI